MAANSRQPLSRAGFRLRPMIAVFWGLIFMSSPALAQIMFEVRNNTSAKVFVCLRYHDVVSDSRITRGWWDVAPYNTRIIRINTDKNDFSWYAYNESGKAWGGAEDDPASESRHVVLENFLAKDGWKPRGRQHRKVFMKKVSAPGGSHMVNLTGQ